MILRRHKLRKLQEEEEKKKLESKIKLLDLELALI